MTAVGPVGKAIEAVANTLADCYYFRRWSGSVWTREQADAHIFQYGLPLRDGVESYSREYLESLRPYCEIYLAEQGVELDYDSSSTYEDSSVVIMRFEQTATTADRQQSELEFANFIDNVFRTTNNAEPGFVELSISQMAGYYVANRIVIEPTQRTAIEQQPEFGDAQQCYVVLEGV